MFNSKLDVITEAYYKDFKEKLIKESEEETHYIDYVLKLCKKATDKEKILALRKGNSVVITDLHDKEVKITEVRPTKLGIAIKRNFIISEPDLTESIEDDNRKEEARAKEIIRSLNVKNMDQRLEITDVPYEDGDGFWIVPVTVDGEQMEFDIGEDGYEILAKYHNQDIDKWDRQDKQDFLLNVKAYTLNESKGSELWVIEDLDFTDANEPDGFKDFLSDNNIRMEDLIEVGPGGGNPNASFVGPKQALIDMVNKFFDPKNSDVLELYIEDPEKFHPYKKKTIKKEGRIPSGTPAKKLITDKIVSKIKSDLAEDIIKSIAVDEVLAKDVYDWLMDVATESINKQITQASHELSDENVDELNEYTNNLSHEVWEKFKAHIRNFNPNE